GAVDMAAVIAGPAGAEVVVLHVMRHAGSGRVPAELRALGRVEHIEVTEHEMLERVAQQIVDAAAKRLRARGLTKVATRIAVGDPAAVVVETARESKADLIVIGRRGLGGIGSTLLGSVSLKVSQIADTPVLTVK
ncbi:MAG: universal stress protein, partial [Reyranellaceae bacterium]